MKRINHHIIGWAFLVLFLSYTGGLIRYTHFSLTNGRLVVHAHKMTKEQREDPFHHHSAIELVHLQQISDFSVTGGLAFFSVVAPQYFSILQFEEWERNFIISHIFHKIHRRGPPHVEL